MMIPKLSVFDTGQFPVLVLNNFRITGYNSASKKFFAKHRIDSLMGKLLWEIINDNDNVSSTEESFKTKIIESPAGGQLIFRLKNNSPLDEKLQFLLEFTPCETGNENLIIGFIRDKNEKSNLFHLYKKAQRENHDLLRYMKAAVYKTNSDSLVPKFMSNNITSLTGYLPTEFIANPNLIIDIIDETDKTRIVEKLQEITAHKENAKFTYRCRDKSNNLKWIEHQIYWETENNKNWYIFGLLYDVTIHKNVEKLILDREKNHKQLIDESPLGIFRMTVNGEVEIANRSILALHGFTNIAQLKKCDALSILLGDQYNEMIRILGLNNSHSFTATMIDKSGNETSINIFLKGVKDVEGNLKYIDGYTSPINN